MKKIFHTAIPALIIISIALSGCGYNTMQKLEKDVYITWGYLESSLQARTDLIPNLVTTVRNFTTSKGAPLSGVIKARSQAIAVKLNTKDLSNPQAVADFQKAQSNISSSLSRFMAATRKNPALRADKHFRDLIHQLENNGKDINVARQRYNRAVKDFNFSTTKFPNSITNNIILNLKKKEYFKVNEQTKEKTDQQGN